MNDHIDGTDHYWEFIQFLNHQYSGAALVSCDAMVMCRKCGSWKIVPQEDYTRCYEEGKGHG